MNFSLAQKDPRYQSKLSPTEIELLLEQRRAEQMARAEQAERRQNIYNRQPGKARVLIGEWAEDRTVYEIKEKLGMDPHRRDEGAKACMTDFRIDTTTQYQSSNREYGVPIPELPSNYKKTLCPPELKTRPLANTAPYKEETLRDQHRSHNFLGVTEEARVPASTTTRESFKQHDDEPEAFAAWDFTQPVKLHPVDIRKAE